MSRTRPHPPPALVAAIAMALPAAAVPAEAGAWWRAPVEGPVVGRFAVGPDPYAAGQRRGIDLAASAGSRVVAPCAGRVAFVGRVPRHGGAVSIRCGALTATVLGLGSTAVAAGRVVERGTEIGSVGAGGRVRLGARRTAARFGYRDPEALLRHPAGTPVAVPAGRRPRLGRGPRGARPRPRTMPRPVLAAPRRAPGAAAAARVRPGLVAWLGLGLVAVAVPAGALVARRPVIPGSRTRHSTAPVAR